MKTNSIEFIENLKQWAEEKKAENIICIDIREKSQFADYMIICHGIQHLHVKAIAQHIIDKSQEIGNKPFAVEGMSTANWILLDYIDVIVHVFNEDTRKYYRLEELWNVNAKNVKNMSEDNDKAEINK